MNNSTPSSGRFLGLINRFRSPSQDAAPRGSPNGASHSTPGFLQRNLSKSSFALTNASSSTINSMLSDNRGSPAGELEYMDYEDVPMPVFECDWMNEDSPPPLSANKSYRSTVSSNASLPQSGSSTLLNDRQATKPMRPSSPLPPSRPSTSSLRNHALPAIIASSGSSNHTSGGYSPSGTSGLDSSGDRMRKSTMLGSKSRAMEQNAPDEGGLRTLVRGWTKSKEALVKTRSPSALDIHTVSKASYIENEIVPTLSASLNRAPLLRNPSGERVLSVSQPAFALSDTVTPALSRPGLMSKRIGAKWKPPTASTGKPMRRATRVTVSDMALTADEEANEGASEGGEGQSPDAPDESLTAPTPSLHGRSRSDVPPASPRFDGVETARVGAATVTISSSAYLNRNRRPLPAQPVFAEHRSADSSADFSPPGELDRRQLSSSIRARQPLKAINTLPLVSQGRPLPPSPDEIADSANRSYASSSRSEYTPPRADEDMLRRESKEVRRIQVFEETAARLAQAGPSRQPMEERRSTSAMSTYATANYYQTDSPPPSRRSSIEIRTGERETTILGARSGMRTTHQRDNSFDGQASVDRSTATMRQVRPQTQRQGSATSIGESSRAPPLQQNRPTPPLRTSRQEQEVIYYDENQENENQYESRSVARKPQATPSYQQPLSQSQPSHSQYTSSNRPVLGEIYRQQQQLPPSPLSNHQSQSSSRGQQYSNDRHAPPGDFQIPLRDNSPGQGEMTPSVTAQPRYQSQSAQSQMQYAQPPNSQQPQQPLPAPPRSTKEKKNYFVVNGKKYSRIDVIGKGGSSKVWRVISDTGGIFALKQVSIRAHDAETRASFVNEITLLEKLRGHPQIINLIASDMTEKSLQMVLELGEVDLNVLLCGHLAKPISMNFIRYIFEQMLEAVQVIHNEEVVHTDLKPANFVLVKGCLKLIDFGISKAIANDTTNIGRDQQVGTANYMPPEALLDSGMGDGGKRLMKLGKPSDVWSLGCILYQMVYSYTPFSIYKDISRKIVNIQNPSHVIHFPDMAIPLDSKGQEKGHLAVRVGDDLKEAMRSCLRWDPKLRAKIPALLAGEFLRGKPVTAIKTVEVDEALMAVLTQRMAVMLRGKRLSPDDAIIAASKLFKESLDSQALAKLGA